MLETRLGILGGLGPSIFGGYLICRGSWPSVTRFGGLHAGGQMMVSSFNILKQ